MSSEARATREVRRAAHSAQSSRAAAYEGERASARAPAGRASAPRSALRPRARARRRPPCWATRPGRAASRTCTPRAAARSRADQRRSLKRGARQCDLIAAAGRARGIEHRAANRAFGQEPRVDGARTAGPRARRRAATGHRRSTRRRSGARSRRCRARGRPRSPRRDPHPGRPAKADPAAGAVVGNEQPALIRLAIALAEQGAQAGSPGVSSNGSLHHPTLRRHSAE